MAHCWKETVSYKNISPDKIIQIRGDISISENIMKIRLHKDAFFRRYNGIGYLLQQKDERNLVLDTNGMIFFQFITRKAKDINIICQEICKMYKNADISVIKNDFLEFISKMEKLNFVITGKTEKEIKEKEQKTNSSNHTNHNYIVNSTNEEKKDINKVLQKHFDKYPQILTLEIEITPFCNLHCVHCYLNCNDVSQKQMSYKMLCRVLKEFRDMGGLQVTFTGGEAMLNKDLPKLLKYARKLDLSITILTNAALLDCPLLKAIKETNVAKIQVSLYSINAKDHDAITQIKGSFQKSKKSIEKLLKNNIKVQIACPVMKENINTFQEVLKWGIEHKVKVKVEGTIMAKADFSTNNLTHRLDLKEQKKFIISTIKNNPVYQRELLENADKEVKTLPSTPVCGAGRYMLCLEAGGDYYPCPGFKLKLGNCKKQSLQEIWGNSKKLNELRHLTNSNYEKCLKCKAKKYCDICPGRFYNESGGDMFKLSDYFCKVAHLTKQIAEEFVKEHKKLN